MQAFKQFLQFYVVGIFLVIITTLLLGAGFLKIITSPAPYILPLIFCTAGYIAGLVVFELNLRPPHKKKKLFAFGYSFGLLALLAATILISVQSIREVNHKKQFGNVEANHAVMKTWVNDNEEYIRIAFDRLEREFTNPNDFDLDAFSVRKRDTMINGLQDTIYSVYFVYFLNSGIEHKYFSKLLVLQSKPELILYNEDTRINEEYKKIKAEKEQEEREMMKELNKIYKQLKDTLKKKD